jgi:hypothetical protein
MLVKIHESYRITVAICDSNLLEKTFEEGAKEIKITSSFFGGEEKTEAEVLEIMEDYSANDATFNIVGKQATSLALKSGLIKKDGITKIQDIPIALVLL